MVRFLWSETVDEPLVTTLDQATYKLPDVPFPAISVCDVNKISRRTADEFATLM